jgi:Family of unknown function (DUF5947)
VTQTLRALIERSGAAQPSPSTAATPAPERCDLCAAPIPEVHRHALDLDRRELMCACRPCALLFEHGGAGNQGRHWRLIPELCRKLADLELGDLTWRSLGLPVELAFFVRDGTTGAVAAHYPSPAGATQCLLALESWDEIEADNPELSEMEPDVEALLVDGTGDGRRAFLVGLDECYRLVALIRTHWRGFGGGEDVWREIATFFAALEQRASADRSGT